MKRLEKLSMVAVMLLLSVTMAFAQQKPNIHILATGGTIAGTGTSATATNYTAGQVAIGTLLFWIRSVLLSRWHYSGLQQL